MSTKVKRKVTVENSKESDEPRRPSVFERLGPGAGNVAPQPAERHSRTAEHNEKCRNWLRTGVCTYGSACRYTHKAFSSTSRRSAKSEKEMEVKDLRHKVKTKRDEPKESRKDSASPKPRKSSKRSRSRSRKGDHEGKIKSTVVVTRPRSPAAMAEATESKKKPENWEDDSDDWPMDAAQLDYKEELTLERKRQQLQRELELELQKEQLLNEGVTITKTVSFSESSSTSSSSDSGSISSSSESSTSSSEGDSNETSSSTSSSSSSSSRPPIKKKNKKSQLKELSRSLKSKSKDDYEKTKRSAKSKKARSPSPALESRKASRKAKDKIRERNLSPPVSKKRHSDGRSEGKGLNVRVKGPRTPSPPKSRKQRQWAQSSSADSRTADLQRTKGKRHKKKKDTPRSEKRKSERILSPPPLSSPNRLALLPAPSKKSKLRDESGSKSRRRHREPSPMLLPRASSTNVQPVKMLPSSRYMIEEKPMDKIRADDRGRLHSKRDPEELLTLHKRTDSHERVTKRSRVSPRKELRKASLSPPPLKERYDSEAINRKLYAVAHEKDKLDRRRLSVSPMRSDRRKMGLEMEKKRDIRESPPREHDPRREGLYRGPEAHGYDKRGGEAKVKRFVSPEIKKGREDKSRDHVKERGVDYDMPSWQGDHRKPGSSSSGRRTPEPRGRQEMRSQAPLLRSDRSRERDSDRKKSLKKRDLSVRSIDEAERARLPSPRRSESPLHAHHAVREIESLTGTRSRMYESDLPPTDREYAYGYDSLHDPFLSERLLPPEYDSEVLRGPPVYPSEYSDSRYRRGTKDPLDRYEPRDISPRDVLPHRDIISLTGRGDDYLPDLPIDERSYDDRWPRGRARDDWDPYPAIAPAPLPPHVAAALDEDRYGMPRRRRASPSEWPRSRIEERDTAINPTHRPVGRGPPPPPPREGRSRSPGAKPAVSNRNSWNDRSGRRDRSIESRQHEDAPKILDDRKGRPPIKKDKIKPKSESSVEDKTPISIKEKAPVKRPHSPSPSPQVKAKKRRNDIQASDILKYHGASENADKKASPAPAKKVKEDPKSGSKAATNSTRVQKSADAVKKETEPKASVDGKIPTLAKERAPVKRNPSSPAPASKVNKNRRSDIQALDVVKYHGSNSNLKKGKQETPPLKSEPLSTTEKSDTPSKNSGDNKAKDNRKSRKTDDNTRGEDDFSDWSDDDDDLLTRDDFTDTVGSTEKGRHKADESLEGNSRRREKHSSKESQDFRREKESSGGRDRDRSNDEALHSKDSKSIVDAKETDTQESLSVKEDTATDVDEYITAESVDYDPISDDELDALIEEPDETLIKPTIENEKSKIVDALDVNWSAIMSETKTEFVPGFARQRFKAAHVLSRIGFSQALAGSELSGKIIALCQKQLDEEDIQNEDNAVKEEDTKEEKKFVMEHQLAAFHVSISQNKRERVSLFSKVGPYRRALCARRDLQIRKILNKPLNKLCYLPSGR